MSEALSGHSRDWNHHCSKVVQSAKQSALGPLKFHKSLNVLQKNTEVARVGEWRPDVVYEADIYELRQHVQQRFFFFFLNKKKDLPRSSTLVHTCHDAHSHTVCTVLRKLMLPHASRHLKAHGLSVVVPGIRQLSLEVSGTIGSHSCQS